MALSIVTEKEAMKTFLDKNTLSLTCRGGGVVNALASRSKKLCAKGAENEQVSQWAFGLARVRIPSPAFTPNHLM